METCVFSPSFFLPLEIHWYSKTAICPYWQLIKSSNLIVISLNCQWGQIFVCTKPLKKYFGYNMIPFDAYYAETFIELSVGTDLCLHKTTQKVFWIQYDHIWCLGTVNIEREIRMHSEHYVFGGILSKKIVLHCWMLFELFWLDGNCVVLSTHLRFTEMYYFWGLLSEPF